MAQHQGGGIDGQLVRADRDELPGHELVHAGLEGGGVLKTLDGPGSHEGAQVPHHVAVRHHADGLAVLCDEEMVE